MEIGKRKDNTIDPANNKKKIGNKVPQISHLITIMCRCLHVTLAPEQPQLMPDLFNNGHNLPVVEQVFRLQNETKWKDKDQVCIV